MINDPFFIGQRPFRQNFSRNNYYTPYGYYATKKSFAPQNCSGSQNSHNKTNFENKNIPHKKTTYEETKKSEFDDEQFFEIFGIKLYFDDILIICLIFFLFQEGVNDQYLFIVLILLLLS